MFIFQFKLQGEIKDYLIKKQKKGMKIAAIITGLIFFIPAVIIGSIWYQNTSVLIIAIGLTAFAVLFIVAFSRWDCPFNGFYKTVPIKIVIDTQQGIVERTGNTAYSYQRVEMLDIKNIVDFGEWYEINFYYPNRNMFFICRKNLIVEGTIEEFEELFKDKIVRKHKEKD